MNWNSVRINPIKAKVNPIFHLLALYGAHHILHVSRVRVKRMGVGKDKKWINERLKNVFNRIHIRNDGGYYYYYYYHHHHHHHLLYAGYLHLYS